VFEARHDAGSTFAAALAGPLNTQTHLLVGAALLARPAAGDGPARRRLRIRNGAALTGALLPDLSLFVMWGQAKVRGIDEAAIWGALYPSAGWQFAGAVTNSMPLYTAAALAAILAGARVRKFAGPTLAMAALVAALAALSHVAADLPLHATDGRPHLWPLSDWVFRSPVSYWDPRHHGEVWGWFETALAVGLIVVLCRRFRALWVRGLLVAAFGTYGAATLYWTLAFG